MIPSVIKDRVVITCNHWIVGCGVATCLVDIGLRQIDVRLEGVLIMSQRRRKYTSEYRWEMARLVIDSHRPITYAVQELGVGAGLLGK